MPRLILADTREAGEKYKTIKAAWETNNNSRQSYKDRGQTSFLTRERCAWAFLDSMPIIIDALLNGFQYNMN